LDTINTYKTLTQKTSAEFKDRGSKFISYIFPVKSIEEIKKSQKTIKEIHPKAIHHCYAYRLGISNNEYRAVDDGEPAGSAGKPILSQLTSFDITNVLIIVVRYWGGVLLGVPGLINAYRTAAHDAILLNTIEEKNVEEIVKLQFDYTLQNEVMRIIKLYNCTIYKQSMMLFCDIEIGIPLKIIDEVKPLLVKLNGVEVNVEF
jgi:uncharacterized YigZ family protein